MGSERAFASCDALAAAMGMDGVAVSLNGQPLHSSDTAVARLEDRQFVLGEGPSVDSFTRQCPVEVPNTADVERGGWLQLDIRGAGFGAAFAFPAMLAGACLGAVSLYRLDPGTLSGAQRALARLATDAAALEVAAMIVAARYEHRAIPALRPVDDLQQAVGIVMVQLDVGAEEAMSRIRAHAYRTNCSLEALVDDLRRHSVQLVDDRPTAAPNH